MTRVSAKDLYDGVAHHKEPRHDTLYCNPSHYRILLDEATKGMMSGRPIQQKEAIKIAGLDVIQLDRIERPIVCEKGEVFDLAKDF